MSKSDFRHSLEKMCKEAPPLTGGKKPGPPYQGKNLPPKNLRQTPEVHLSIYIFETIQQYTYPVDKSTHISR